MSIAERLWNEKKKMVEQLCDITYEMGALIAVEEPDADGLEKKLQARQELMGKIDHLDKRIAAMSKEEFTPECVELKEDIRRLLIATLAEDRANSGRLGELADGLSVKIRSVRVGRKGLGAYGQSTQDASIGFDVQK